MVIKYKDDYFEMLLDDNVNEFMNKFKWQYRCGYAGRLRSASERLINKGHWIHAHREVLRINNIEIPNGLVVDHINRNKMDNRLANLRVVTRRDNALNVSDIIIENRKENVKIATSASALLPRTEKQVNFSKNIMNFINKNGLNAHIGVDNYMSKKVINCYSGITYDSIRIAANSCGYNYSTLRSMLNGTNPNTSPFIIVNP